MFMYIVCIQSSYSVRVCHFSNKVVFFFIVFRSLVGIVAMSELTSLLVSGAVLPSDSVTKAFVKRYRRVSELSSAQDEQSGG